MRILFQVLMAKESRLPTLLPEHKATCRGLNHQISGTEANLIRCGEFLLTAKPRPHVVSNSWGSGSGGSLYDSIITLWRYANIVPVSTLGYAGPACGTTITPANRPGVISVSATGRGDIIFHRSARGPTSSGIRKPEVSAPEADILSCGTGPDNYAISNGAAMATPSVAAVCLILSQNPGMTVDQVLERLESTAEHPTLLSAGRGCGLPGSGDFPNNAFGADRIDVGRAVGV